MLERGDAELQRELGHLLAALTQMQPLLRNLQLEVRRRSRHAACKWSEHIRYLMLCNDIILPVALVHLQPLTRSFWLVAHPLAGQCW